jgi:hypothetical protein
MIFNLCFGDRRQVVIVPPLNLPYQDFHLIYSLVCGTREE